MPNMLTTHQATFRKPTGTTPQGYTDELPCDCTFSQASASQMSWARFVGVSYGYKLCVILSDSKRAEVTEDWRVMVGGVEYEIKDINHKVSSMGYDHSNLMLSKIAR